VGFGEDQVSFGWFSWEFLSFCCFFFSFSFCLGCFSCVLGSPLGFVGFSFFVNVNGSGLWFWKRSGEFRVVFVGIS